MEKRYGMQCGDFDIAVAGLRVLSENENSCCVTLELKTELAEKCAEEIRSTFLNEARKSVSKGAKPDFLRFGEVYRTFKGTIRLQEIKKEWAKDFQKQKK